MMTNQRIGIQMVRQFCVAPAAVCDPAAIVADHDRCEASPVNEDQDLLVVCESLTNLVAQCPGKPVFLLQVASIQELVAFWFDAGWARRKF